MVSASLVSQQLPLSLGLRPTKRLIDFLPGDNAALLAAMASVLSGNESQLFLWGPACSGRTHLLLGACAAAEDQGLQVTYIPLLQHEQLAVDLLEGMENLDLLALDDIQSVAQDPQWELAVFNLYNRARERTTRMLFAGDTGPATLPLALPDLRTRLAWGLTFQLQPLDDTGKQHLLAREAKQRGMELPEGAARYILTHCKRDLSNLIRLLDDLDRASLAAKSKLTLRFVRNHVRGEIN